MFCPTQLSTERLRRAVGGKPIRTRQGSVSISTSVGFTVRKAGEVTTVEELIDWADRALLKSKSLGRDQVGEIA